MLLYWFMAAERAVLRVPDFFFVDYTAVLYFMHLSKSLHWHLVQIESRYWANTRHANLVQKKCTCRRPSEMAHNMKAINLLCFHEERYRYSSGIQYSSMAVVIYITDSVDRDKHVQWELIWCHWVMNDMSSGQAMDFVFSSLEHNIWFLAWLKEKCTAVMATYENMMITSTLPINKYN